MYTLYTCIYYICNFVFIFIFNKYIVNKINPVLLINFFFNNKIKSLGCSVFILNKRE